MTEPGTTPKRAQLRPFPEATTRSRKIVSLQLLGSMLRGAFHVICFPLFLLRSHSISRQMESIIRAEESRDCSDPAAPSS